MVYVYRNVYILALLLAVPGSAFAQGGSVQEKGIEVFVEKRCYTCHTVKAEAAQVDAAKAAFAASKGVELKESDDEDDKDSKGGDLSDIGAAKDAQWLSAFLKNPKDYFLDTPACKKLARQKDRKRFRGTDAELNDLTAWLVTLKYGDMQDPEFENCLKEE